MVLISIRTKNQLQQTILHPLTPYLLFSYLLIKIYYWKNYSNKKKLGRINSLRVSSVELVASRSFIKKNSIRFNKNLGLGSNYPSTEENIFYLDIFDTGGLVSHYPEFLIKHEYINRKAIHFKDEFILKAKGAFCRRYGGLVGFMILGYYSLKCLFISKNLLIMLNLFFGYVNAQTIIELYDEWSGYSYYSDV